MSHSSRLWAVIVVAVGSAVGCAPDQRGSSDHPARAPLECETRGYPCRWKDVSPEVVRRTDLTGEIAGLYGASGASLGEIAEYLEARPGMAAVQVVGTGVRFRLEGGRPAWIYPGDELAHHRSRSRPGNQEVDRTADPEVPRRPPQARLSAAPGQNPLTTGAQALATLLAPRLFASAQSAAQGVADDEPGTGKRALVLSPFEHEFPGTGPSFARRANVIRDYRQRYGGEVVYHADLDMWNADAPAVSPERLVDGTPLLTGPVEFEDFLTWDHYNLVVLASHGTEHPCAAPPPVGGKEAPRLALPEGPHFACPMIWAGHAKEESYAGFLGVEVLTYVGSIHGANPGLTRDEAEWCAGEMEAGAASESIAPPPETAGGKRCQVTVGERSRRLLGLWTPFFEEQYRSGLNNVIVFMAACRSGIGNVLLDLLAPPGNEHVTVIGFDTTVSGEDAFEVGRRLLDLINQGFHTREILARLARMDRTKHMVGRSLAPGDESPPATPSKILDASAGPTHGRDIVLLIDPATGEELVDGSAVRVVGMAGDGAPDRLRIHPQVIGVAETDPRSRLQLRVSEKDAVTPRETYDPDLPVGEGAYRHADTVALGRDHTNGETVDLEVRLDWREGGFSRWFYRSIRLTSYPCEFTATVSASPYAGHYEGPATLLGKALQLSDARTDWEATIEIPALDPGRYDAGMNVLAATAPIPGAPGRSQHWFASPMRGRTPGSVEIIQVDPDRTQGFVAGRVTGRDLGWRARSEGFGYLDFEAEFRAVPFGVGRDSAYRHCRQLWNVQSRPPSP